MHELAKGFPELASLALSLKQVNCDANYDAILASLRQLFADHNKTVADVIANLKRASQQLAQPSEKEIEARRNAERLHSSMYYLDAQTKSPSFQRCFLLIGSLGAGKTHFIASLLATSPMQNKNFLLLNLSLSSDRSLDEQILQGINEATDKVWSSLKEFNAFLKGGKRMRLVISIDDLHKWLSSGECLKDLIDVISAHTDLNAIYWLITLEYTSYDKVADDEVADESESHPWKVYSYRPKKEEHHHLNAKDQERLISIGGWLDLDELNRSRKIGLELLRQQLSSKDEDDLRALQTLDERADALRYLSSPFIAWILRHLREELQLPLSRVVNLNFIEFITYYWRKLRSIIDPHPLSREQVQQCILLIAEFLVQSNDLAPNRTFLLNRIQKAAIDRSDLQDRRLAEAALAVLERGPLLVRKKTNLEANFMERTEIRFEPFWEYQMASQLQHATIERGYTDEAWSKIQTWFRLCHPQGIKQGVFEFLLLLLDRDLNYKSSDIIDNMLNLGINDQESLTAAMWFAGPKLSIEKQSSLVDLAAMPRAYTNTRNLFAFMYFVSECVPEVLDIPSRLALLQPHYKTIHEASLVNYYLYIVERLFMKLKDNNIVLSCMMHFSGCEIMGITQILAELAVKRLAQNMRDEMNVHSEMNGLLDIVLEYLRVDYKKTKRDHQTGSNVTSQVRYFYRQWILCEFCRTLVDSVGLTSYDLLVKHHWYEPRKLQIGYPASLEMRQEANLALGTWYRNKAWGEERKFYIELTKKLANSSDPEDRRRAFFLIRHTELTKGRRGVRVERAFHPLLRTLFMDPELQKITESYYEDFQVNLNDVDSLAD